MTETAPTLSAPTLSAKPPAARLFGAVRAMAGLSAPLEKRDEAERLCREALERDPDDHEALAGLGWLAFLWDDLDRAAGLLTRATALAEATDTTDAAGRAEIWYTLGHVQGTRNDTQAAEAAYRAAVALSPRHLDALNSLGLLLRHLDRLDEAAAAFDAIVAIKPTHAGAIRRRGTVLFKAGDLDGAEASYRQAIEVKPDYIEAFLNLGEVMEARGDRTAALDAYRTAVSIKYDFAPSHQMLGDLLARMGRTEEAVPLLTRAVALQPWHADPHRSLIRLGHRW